MKVYSLRKIVPANTLPLVPVVFRLSVQNPVIKKVIAITSASALLEQMGYKITNQGINVFPFNGSGSAAGEDGYAPFIPISAGGLQIELQEVVFGPPYEIELQAFNRTGSDINIDVMIFSDGKTKPQQVEVITSDDNKSSELAG